GQPESAQRQTLLYLFKPDYFLAVVGRRHRAQLRAALAAAYLPRGASDDLDADLRAIDDAVQAVAGGPVDYYLTPWRERWLHDASDPTNGEVAQNGNGHAAAAEAMPAAAAAIAAAPTPVAPAVPVAPPRKYHPMAPGAYRQSSGFPPPDRPDHNRIELAAAPGTPASPLSDRL